MANGERGAPTVAVRTLSRFERLPVRRIVLVGLTAAIVLVVGGGIAKTLTLPAGQRLSWSFWANLIIIGTALGSIYALIALGYTLVYGILRMINFAHGEVFMAGAFGSFFVASALDSSGFLSRNPVASIAILLVVSMAVSMFVAILLEGVAYRPLRGAPRLV